MMLVLLGRETVDGKASDSSSFVTVVVATTDLNETDTIDVQAALLHRMSQRRDVGILHAPFPISVPLPFRLPQSLALPKLVLMRMLRLFLERSMLLQSRLPAIVLVMTLPVAPPPQLHERVIYVGESNCQPPRMRWPPQIPQQCLSHSECI